MPILVKSRSKGLKDVSIASADSLESVLAEVSKANKSISTNRLRLTYQKENKQIPIQSSSFFKEHNEETLYFKDLGPQISWRLVFVVEYFGPILVHSLLYALSRSPEYAYLHSSSVNYDPQLSRLLYLLIIGHYLKREFETFFVHSFSHSTMPLFNLFKNSFHYWVLNGMIALSYFGYGFLLPVDKFADSYVKYRNNMVGFFITSEIWNLYSHVQLRRWGDAQKARGVTARVPINDGIFKYFVSPNYTFEVWAWICFTVISKLNVFSVIFLVVSSVQMYIWAQKKNKNYGTKRAFLIPYIL
ncbi:HBR184Wp [Eremothecium sinecaudum]|uniref:HBR184Wp n=1 Tax=Eremothecium sinecaudum TaxID=45286 RepID=A0A109UX27_9SACH|nr:HBR184Wp [Eremothecium sinecaudum]AMD19085.1 HBR184Wp [Eremothecium sinecaudum]